MMAVRLPVALIGSEPSWKTAALKTASSGSPHKKTRRLSRAELVQ